MRSTPGGGSKEATDQEGLERRDPVNLERNDRDESHTVVRSAFGGNSNAVVAIDRGERDRSNPKRSALLHRRDVTHVSHTAAHITGEKK